MYQEGHIGIALLFYGPVAYIYLELGTPWLVLFFTTLTAITLANLPDIDLKTRFLSHRGSTHTILFALIIGLFTAFTFLGVISLFKPLPTEIRIGAWILGFLTGFTPILSHIFGDMLTPMGVKPFWPISDKKITTKMFKARNRIANTSFLIIGVFIFTSIIWLHI
ncbi:metal-dependent hydrolase [Methanonatronarchaeum sp. AMET-Sl]|uniref:metal-dependent hydrolase n=1 Tax=Methanonatronarchaeum sp. AMET-Sl TaxID=3037654 RepID=UPI00244DE427|nr:metal-dependent hydrolase [Methanonatronarchaeum sp. AMET-Sl]WGI18126.1 metal-dependent hydrolase [Methanonatronarchaeum sp. AMET-Sl]